MDFFFLVIGICGLIIHFFNTLIATGRRSETGLIGLKRNVSGRL